MGARTGASACACRHANFEQVLSTCLAYHISQMIMFWQTLYARNWQFKTWKEWYLFIDLAYYMLWFFLTCFIDDLGVHEIPIIWCESRFLSRHCQFAPWHMLEGNYTKALFSCFSLQIHFTLKLKKGWKLVLQEVNQLAFEQ